MRHCTSVILSEAKDLLCAGAAARFFAALRMTGAALRMTSGRDVILSEAKDLLSAGAAARFFAALRMTGAALRMTSGRDVILSKAKDLLCAGAAARFFAALRMTGAALRMTGAALRMTAAAVALCMVAPGAIAADDPAKHDPQNPGWYLGAGFTFVKADDKRGSGDGKGGTLTVGHHGDVASIEVSGIYTTMDGAAQLLGGQVALVYGPIVNAEFLSRFVGIFGLGAFQEQSIPGKRVDGSGLFGDLGIGYLQPLGLFDRKTNLRIDARYRADYQMAPREAYEPSYFTDFVFNVAIQIPLSRERKPAPPPKPAPPQVVPPVEPTAQPADSTIQPSSENATPAPAESGAPDPTSPSP
jgi:hypothetical protein